jgi:hypothetical protein
MEARLPRETDRLLLLAFFAFFSSLSELLDEDPARAGVSAASAGAASVVSAGLGVTSVLFLGVELAAAAVSAVGLPSRGISGHASGNRRMRPFIF